MSARKFAVYLQQSHRFQDQIDLQSQSRLSILQTVMRRDIQKLSQRNKAEFLGFLELCDAKHPFVDFERMYEKQTSKFFHAFRASVALN